VFVVLVVYIYFLGLCVFVMIVFVKDGLIYLVIFVVIIYLLYYIGGWVYIFDVVEIKMVVINLVIGKLNGVFILNMVLFWLYVMFVFGLVMVLFMYLYLIMVVLFLKSCNVIWCNVLILLVYLFLFGLLVLFGFVVIVAGIKLIGLDGKSNV